MKDSFITAYVEVVGHEPPAIDDPQWRYQGKPKERKTLKEELAA